MRALWVEALVVAVAAGAVGSASGQQPDQAMVYRCQNKGVLVYTSRPTPALTDCVSVSQYQAGPQRLVGPPSILPQCLDQPTPGVLAGPSARARECTRQYCGTPRYKEKVRSYALGYEQSQEDSQDALTCITRSEQDMRQR